MFTKFVKLLSIVKQYKTGREKGIHVYLVLIEKGPL